MKFLIFSLFVFVQVLNIESQAIVFPGLFDRSNYDKYVKYQCWSNASTSFNSPLGDNLVAKGCPANGNFAFVFPGFFNDYTKSNDQFQSIVQSLLQYRGGCVCLVDYRAYTCNPGLSYTYPIVVGVDYYPIATSIAKKVREVGNNSRMMFYGFSLGSRWAFEVGAQVGGDVSKIDACDTVALNFDGTQFARDPKTAGVNVQCIHTTGTVGTIVTNCHQNWRMGPACGWVQTGNPEVDHKLCNEFYKAAFTRNFTPKECVLNGLCMSPRPAPIASAACAGARMGYSRPYNTTACTGDFFAPANSTAPYSNN